jgi:hypothetical protein
VIDEDRAVAVGEDILPAGPVDAVVSREDLRAAAREEADAVLVDIRSADTT